jgi:hypothetical protein
MTKQMISIAVNDLPEEFDLDELFEKLVFIEKVEEARQQVRDGKTISNDEMGKKILEWRK